MNKYFVTAIGTDSGKTIISAILTEALEADYWKPIQAGLPKDSDRIKALVSREKCQILEERYLLNTPASPHYAAEVDLVNIQVKDFQIPEATSETIVIEGAGGVLVPINESEFVIDIATSLNCKVIVVCNLYLGSINHSLLTLSELAHRGISIEGIIFNGEPNAASEEIILKHSRAKKLLHVLPAEHIDKGWIKSYAEELKKNL